MLYKYITLIALVMMVFSCQQSKNLHPVSDYFSEQEHKAIVAQLIPYIEKRYTGKDIARQEGYDQQLRDSCYIASMYKDSETERYHFVYIKKDIKSTPDDARAVIGSFKMNDDQKIISVFQDYITYRIPTSTAINNGKGFLLKHIRNESLEKYMNKQGHIQWPDENVKFDYEKEKWVY